MMSWDMDYNGLPFKILYQGREWVSFCPCDELTFSIEHPEDGRIIGAIRLSQELRPELDAMERVSEWVYAYYDIRIPPRYSKGIFTVVPSRSAQEIEYYTPLLSSLSENRFASNEMKQWAIGQLRSFRETNLLEIKKRDVRSEITQKYASIKRKILKRDGAICRRCGAAKLLELDHILPVCKGGGNEPENLQILCKSCNAKKGGRV